MIRDARGRSSLDETGEILIHLAEFLDLTGEYFLKGPDRRFEELLADDGWHANLRRAGLVEGTPGGRSHDADSHKQVFASLVRVPGDAFIPPFEEAYRASGSSSDLPAHAKCQQLYDLAGYDRSPFESIQSDHVGHQLRFLGATSRREAECMRRDDPEAAGRVATWRRGFIRDRCGWWSEFAKRIDDSTDCLQIRTMATLIRTLQKLLERA